MKKDRKTNMRIVGKLVIIFTVFCLCFNSFTAIISDDDGLVFVTKAQLDALKMSFNK